MLPSPDFVCLALLHKRALIFISIVLFLQWALSHALIGYVRSYDLFLFILYRVYLVYLLYHLTKYCFVSWLQHNRTLWSVSTSIHGFALSFNFTVLTQYCSYFTLRPCACFTYFNFTIIPIYNSITTYNSVIHQFWIPLYLELKFARRFCSHCLSLLLSLPYTH